MWGRQSHHCPCVSRVPDEPGTSPVDKYLAVATRSYAKRDVAREQERNTYCRGSSSGGSSSRHTAPPRRGRRCAHRRRICCHLPSSAWWLCVPRWAGRRREVHQPVSTTTSAQGQFGLQSHSKHIHSLCTGTQVCSFTHSLKMRLCTTREVFVISFSAHQIPHQI